MAVQLLMQPTLVITSMSSLVVTKLLLDLHSPAVLPSPMTAFLHLRSTALFVCSRGIGVASQSHVHKSMNTFS